MFVNQKNLFVSLIAYMHSLFKLIFVIRTILFALIFLLGAGYALKHNRHVRVDLFYANFSYAINNQL